MFFIAVFIDVYSLCRIRPWRFCAMPKRIRFVTHLGDQRSSAAERRHAEVVERSNRSLRRKSSRDSKGVVVLVSSDDDDESDDDHGGDDVSGHKSLDDESSSRDLSEDDSTSSDGDKQKPLQGASSLVAMFGNGWLPGGLFSRLHHRVTSKKVLLDPPTLKLVESFKTAFLKLRGHSHRGWNCNLNDNLSQIKEVRSRLVSDYEQLTPELTTECLRKWAEDYRFRADQKRAPLRYRRGIMNSIINRELGCASRARVLVMRGLTDLQVNAAMSDDALLDQFIKYICCIEQCAAEVMQGNKEIDRRAREGDRDASERAASPTQKACGPPLIPAWKPQWHQSKSAKGKGEKGKGKWNKGNRGKGCTTERPPRQDSDYPDSDTTNLPDGDGDAEEKEYHGRRGRIWPLSEQDRDDNKAKRIT